ncbi:MAG: aldehyde ferredoxin oxidoreductase family protein, partial [Bacillota bacterium]
SEAGGYWGPELKKAGFDAIVINGSSDTPVYLLIQDNQVEIKDAGHLWGLETGPVQEKLREELGDKGIQVAQIGPAGENGVLYANIVNNLAHFNGRNGLGAVMGSKKLKAIAVRGSSKVKAQDEDRLTEIFRWTAGHVKEHPLSSMLHEHGTPAGIKTVNAQGALPTNNFELGVFEEAEDLASEEYSLKPKGCYACPVVCKRVVEVNEDDIVVDKMYGGPEYETLAALGSNCGIGDLKVVAKVNEICNRNTLDTISLGMTISFAMKCFEEGVIGLEDTDGMELKFGNKDILIPLVEKIIRREGIGDILSRGSKNAAEKFGPESEKYLVESKGQEAPMHDPRLKTGLGLQYALSVNGADHWFAQHDPFFAAEDGFGVIEMSALGLTEAVDLLDTGMAKARLIYYTSVLNSAYDLLGVCMFGYAARSLIPLNLLLDQVVAATGWKTSWFELMKSGERALAMAREYNHRQGLDQGADKISDIFYRSLAKGPFAGKVTIEEKDFSSAVEKYYALAGWDKSGGVNRNKLEELGLDWLV